MLDAPLDVWYAWLGLAVAGAVTLGAVSGLPTAPPPDAVSAAATVDAVAAADAPAAARYRIAADRVRVTTRGVSLRSDGGSAFAAFGSGAVVPVDPDGRLSGIALGDSPSRAFDAPEEFAVAVAAARAESDGDGGSDTLAAASQTDWTAGRTLYARHVSWGETDVTLVLVA
ncbi:DUF7283 family protein [Halobaculum gomorrense]|uniref:Uncharacterized protein n=1 Tax=Halobaculum gomorrense TaxID=43928 RepID=A0A1M5TLH2_9EURY|nr:hypothetical protein [Halobaculum gomorrense]SHH51529.1 hypothetical protein SAMN05443636_2755 [Halobaculum gomorrense]